MKQNKFMRFMTSRALILTLQIIASGVFLYFVYLTKMLPTKYFALLIAILVLIVVALWGIIQSAKKKEKESNKTSKRSIISKVLSLIVSIVLVIGSAFVVRGNTFLDSVQTTTQKYVINVIVLKNGQYGSATLKDLKGKKFGRSYEKEKSTLNKALAKMEDAIDTQEYTNFDTYTQLADALYAGKVDAIVVGEQYKSMLEVNHEGFDQETRIVKSYEFEKKAKAVTTAVTDVTEKPFTIYITGIDTYGSVSTVSRSDVNLLVTVNPKTKQILMTSIPRDCQINLHKNGKMDKLTHTGIYGVEETISTIEDFLDLDVNYYARTNFGGITNIIDALGGVTVDSKYEFTTLHGNYHIVKGKQEMDGNKALCFVRERHAFVAGDFVRGQNQQVLLKAMLEKAMSPKIITNYQNILSAIEGCFETNMSSNEIKSLIKMQLDDNADWELFNVQVAGEGYKTEDTYSMKGTSVYVMKPYQSYVKKIKKLIDKVEDGEKLTKSDTKGLDGEE